MAGEEPAGDPGKPPGLKDPRYGGDPLRRPGVRDANQVVGCRELAETRAIDSELLDDATEAMPDLLIHLVRPDFHEAGRKLGHECLEPKAFIESALRLLPLPTLEEQARDEQGLDHAQRDRRNDVPLIDVPD